MKMLEADLSAGKGVLWLKSPHPAPDGTLFVARYMGQGRADFQPGADLFVHLVFGPSGDRCGARVRAGRGAGCGRVRCNLHQARGPARAAARACAATYTTGTPPPWCHRKRPCTRGAPRWLTPPAAGA